MENASGGEGMKLGDGTRKIRFMEAFWFWVKLGFINFGGPAGQIAIMHKELVEEKKWVSESQYLRTLNFCMLLPGPEAQQVATYIGWRLHGTVGGIVAGAFFVIPSIFVLLLLSWLAAAHSDITAVRGLLYGVQPVIIAVVVEATLRIGGRALGHPALIAFAVIAFCALFFLGLPFPLVILAAAIAGIVLQRFLPEAFRQTGHGEPGEEAREEAAEPRRSYAARNLRMVGIFAALWLAPVGAVYLWRGGDDVLFREALFFTGAAFVTFGGAYAVLTYLSDVAVNNYGWLTADQMVQGLGLAESTPGPLIMVTQYVGFFGAYNDPGPFSPTFYGTLGALLTTYVTFLPCFLFIFLLAPYIELLSNNVRLRAALVGVTAAVVGVIANLAVFFAGQVLFPGGVSPGGLDVYALAVAAISFVALQRFGVKIYYAVPVGALVGMAWVFMQG